MTQVHSADYRNPQALPDGPVLVVGGGNSGFQIAEELAATRTVDLSIATSYPMLPQRLAGRDLFWWLTRLGLLRVTVTSRPGRRMSRRDFVIGTNRRGLERRVCDFGRGWSTPMAARSASPTTAFWRMSGWWCGRRGTDPDYAWIHIPGVVREGHVVHRRGVTEVPGLYFVGLSWQHTRGSALLGFVNDDAAYLADRIATSLGTAGSATAGVTRQPSR